MLSKGFFAFLAFLAAIFFFGFATFGATLGDVHLLATGLFCVAIGLALQAAPEL